MTITTDTRRRLHILWGAACACCLFSAGCSEPSTGTAVAHTSVSSTGDATNEQATDGAVTDGAVTDGKAPIDANQALPAAESPEQTATATPAEIVTPVEASTTGALPAKPDAAPAPPKDRSFAVEGPDGALRVGFDDLDLLKIIRMDPVTPDCKEKMPGWLQKLDGKKVRIRGFMKPGLLLTDIPQFMFVRDTGLCCFGPKGKIYDMIAVTLKAGKTTDYIELRPFDVVGTFKIEVLQLDDGMIFGLYYIDDAVIVQSGK